MAYVIGRPINGITVNGFEYVLDENDDVMTFNSIEEAQEFLLSSCYPNIEAIEADGIEIIKEE